MLQSSSIREEIMRKGGEDNGIRTVECLRGRLLAERAASKAAKEEADLMAKRLDEIEKKWGEEIKHRNRAEKRLKFALKKLNSLKVLNVSESSVGSFGSWGTDSGTMDSSGQCVSERDVEEIRGEMGVKDDGLGSSSGDSANMQIVSQEGSWSSVGTANSRSKEEAHQDDRDCVESIADGVRQASNDVDEQSDAVQQAEHSNDTLALVPETYHSDVSSANVQNVLVALRHVKEELRNSMERRSPALSLTKPLYGQSNAVQRAEHSNDTLALVPETYHSDVSSANVQNALVALRHVKQQLRNSMERRSPAASLTKPLYGQQRVALS